MPTPKQMEKLAAKAARRRGPAAPPDAPLPAEYWELVLKDPRADATGAQIRQRRLSEIQRHVLRVSCRRCERTVEIQTADAVRLYGTTRSGRTSRSNCSTTPASSAPEDTKKTGAGRDLRCPSLHPELGLRLDVRMAPKHHPTPLSGGDRKALTKELGKARAMTGILAAQCRDASQGRCADPAGR